MHLGRQNPHRDYTMGATTLATKTSEKDLGVYVDTELTLEKHIETVVNQANRMLGLIRCSYTYLDSQSLLKLYTSLVRPTLEYANAAWTPILRRDQILLENFQPQLFYEQLRHLNTRHFVIINCRHLAKGCGLKCGCIGWMLFRNLSCLGTIICSINTIGIVPVYACTVYDAMVASYATTD